MAHTTKSLSSNSLTQLTPYNTQDPDGTLTRATTVAEVEGMVDVLDRRGLREGALLDALDKHSIVEGLRRAEKRPAAGEKQANPERVQPSRHGKPRAGTLGNTKGKGKSGAKDADADVDPDAQEDDAHPGVEAQAARYAAAALKRLAVILRKAKLKCPSSGTWKACEGELAAVEKGGDVPGDKGAPMCVWLKDQALALEGCMYAVSKDAREEEREETPSEEEV